MFEYDRRSISSKVWRGCSSVPSIPASSHGIRRRHHTRLHRCHFTHQFPRYFTRMLIKDLFTRDIDIFEPWISKGQGKLLTKNQGT